MLRGTRFARLLLGGLFAIPAVMVACAPESRDPGDSANAQTDAVVTENASDKVAFDYFVSKGLTDVQAAGIVGNLDQESGMSPTIAQLGGGPGRGIAQWSVGQRWDTSPNDNVAWYAAQQGASVDSLELQLEFIWYELTTIGYGYAELRAATTVTDAVDAFMKYYEICGNCVAANRVAHAEAALAAFGGSAPSPPSPPTTGEACTAGGVSGTCIDTSTCQSMGYTSTAGLCPGASNIECCTAPAATTTGTGTGTSSGSGSGSGSGGTGGSGSESSSGASGAGGGSSSSGDGTGGSASAPSCSANGVSGTCIDTGVCASMTGYTSTPGFCAGASNIECCTPPPSCLVNGVSGTCIDTSTCAANGGTSTPGFCPGSASEECCTM